MIVMKFGGSSVKDAVMFKRVASIVTERLDKKPLVVLSAVKGVTDMLIKSLDESLLGNYASYEKIAEMHKKIIEELGLSFDMISPELIELKKALETNSKVKENTAEFLDYISFFGERMSVKILAQLLNKQGISSESFVSGDIGLLTDSAFGNATILPHSYKKMKEFLSKVKAVPVITGFGGKDANGRFTTFQRGGSDYVASLFGAAVHAAEIQIWTDVNGIMSADPRIVKNARTIPELSFDEASELAYFGAKVLHPKTIVPAIEKNILVIVLNTFEPEHSGSRIVKDAKKSSAIMKAVSFKKGITVIEAKSTRMLNSHGYLANMFAVFQKYKKPVDMVSTSEINVSMTVDSLENMDEIVKELSEIASVKIHKHRAIVYAVGEGMKAHAGTAARIFSTIGNRGINLEMISQCFDEHSVGFVVREEQAEKAMITLHEEFIK
ncbi:aspartate kinase [Candidatus Woesearchaeota archaeon]|nr:aspartate kinase [Candidatus Woesearchaeota archaeon]